MIVPKFWAEGRLQRKEQGKQVTVRRYGWSDISAAEAQAMADERTRTAFAEIAAGANLLRREPKVAYNGAEGVPIREEIIASHGDTVITRNAYGASCLNTPNVLFADIDFEPKAVGGSMLALAPVLVGVTLATSGLSSTAGLVIAAIVAVFLVWRWGLGRSSAPKPAAAAGAEDRALDRILAFTEAHPTWHLRLYRTPAGIRILVMHQTFDPADPIVVDFFQALGTDPIYVRMCLKQHCFRARVSPKPWRIGIEGHMRPNPGVWPVQPERLPDRNRWIKAYEAKARDFAACRFVKAIGSQTVAAAAEAVRKLHDELAGADTQRPLA
ncbi:MAG TPA: hypothetical protein VL860_02635 [Planctomycetota bacterium]|nr:hypothetical protein [Planctomycetota bacterium]